MTVYNLVYSLALDPYMVVMPTNTFVTSGFSAFVFRSNACNRPMWAARVSSGRQELALLERHTRRSSWRPVAVELAESQEMSEALASLVFAARGRACHL